MGWFTELGQRVDADWQRAGRNEQAFPDIALQALCEMPPPSTLSAVPVLQGAVAGGLHTEQDAGKFGQPSLVLHRARDFYISALYWLDGTTSIHQHAFSGAFRVLEGSSLHSTYAFAEREALTHRLRVGDLSLADAELLRAGDVRPIVAGGSFVHSLFHLHQPTVTIVVRTVTEDVGTQFEYAPPGVAWDPFHEDPRFQRQLAALRTLYVVDRAEARRSALDFQAGADVWSAFVLARYWLSKADASDFVHELVDRIPVGPDAARRLREAFEVLMHRHSLIVRRRFVTDPGHRLLYALLLNLPDRDAVCGVLSSAYPDEQPTALLARWIEELAAPALRGMSGLAMPEPERDALLAWLRGESTATPSDTDVPSALVPLLR